MRNKIQRQSHSLIRYSGQSINYQILNAMLSCFQASLARLLVLSCFGASMSSSYSKYSAMYVCVWFWCTLTAFCADIHCCDAMPFILPLSWMLADLTVHIWSHFLNPTLQKWLRNINRRWYQSHILPRNYQCKQFSICVYNICISCHINLWQFTTL